MDINKAPMTIHFEPKTLICFIVLTVIFCIIIVKGKKD